MNSIEHSDLNILFAFRKAKMTARDSQSMILPERVWESRHSYFSYFYWKLARLEAFMIIGSTPVILGIEGTACGKTAYHTHKKTYFTAENLNGSLILKA